MINGYADAAVIRHFVTGAAADYASASTIPVINGGDGSNEHPSQALLDLYTIKKEKGRIDGLNVLVVGKSTRATLSLCFGLAKFNDININFMCPDNVRIAESNIKYIRDSGASFKEVSKIADVLKETDVIYIINVWPYDKTGTGLKKGDAPEEYILGLDKLQGAKEDLIILHPLPRLDELPKEIDSTPYARYFEQATNGLYIRMALLALVLGKRP
jgi:aspartate carbamoyltransferase catalytic subunit